MTEYNLYDVIEDSKKILSESLQYNPYKTVVAFSGGDDSLTVMEVLKHFNRKPDFALFADTGTCIPATKNFVIEYCKQNNIHLLISHPKKTIRQHIRGNGFWGVGDSAHRISFGELKGKPMLHQISKHIRKGQRGRDIVIFSGIRRDESQVRRTSEKYKSPFYREKRKNKSGKVSLSPNIWVSLIHKWSKEDCLEFLEWKEQVRNPVSIKLGRSGDCHCGTAINKPEKEFKELLQNAPDVAKEISELNQYCIDNKKTRWCEPRIKANRLEELGQCSIFDQIPDLCRGCKNKYVLTNGR